MKYTDLSGSQAERIFDTIKGHADKVEEIAGKLAELSSQLADDTIGRSPDMDDLVTAYCSALEEIDELESEVERLNGELAEMQRRVEQLEVTADE